MPECKSCALLSERVVAAEAVIKVARTVRAGIYPERTGIEALRAAIKTYDDSQDRQETTAPSQGTQAGEHAVVAAPMTQTLPSGRESTAQDRKGCDYCGDRDIVGGFCQNCGKQQGLNVWKKSTQERQPDDDDIRNARICGDCRQPFGDHAAGNVHWCPTEGFSDNCVFVEVTSNDSQLTDKEGK